jgi:hypothetical protein
MIAERENRMFRLLRTNRTLIFGLIALACLVASALYSFDMDPVEIGRFFLKTLLLIGVMILAALPAAALLGWLRHRGRR